jgi:hypothetical protein
MTQTLYAHINKTKKIFNKSNRFALLWMVLLQVYSVSLIPHIGRGAGGEKAGHEY